MGGIYQWQSKLFISRHWTMFTLTGNFLQWFSYVCEGWQISLGLFKFSQVKSSPHHPLTIIRLCQAYNLLYDNLCKFQACTWDFFFPPILFFLGGTTTLGICHVIPAGCRSHMREGQMDSIVSPCFYFEFHTVGASNRESENHNRQIHPHWYREELPPRSPKKCWPDTKNWYQENCVVPKMFTDESKTKISFDWCT